MAKTTNDAQTRTGELWASHAPLGERLDGYTWQGLKVDGNVNITKYQPGYGLRYITGTDPANASTDSFSLGQGSPQVWEPNVYAAGTAALLLRNPFAPTSSYELRAKLRDCRRITFTICRD